MTSLETKMLKNMLRGLVYHDVDTPQTRAACQDVARFLTQEFMESADKTRQAWRDKMKTGFHWFNYLSDKV